MLRYLSGRLVDGNLSGNAFVGVTEELLSETLKYLQSIPELNLTTLDYAMKYQLLQGIGNLLNYLSSIESIQIVYSPTKQSTNRDRDGAYVNLEKGKPKPKLEKSKSHDCRMIKQLSPENAGISEEDAMQNGPKNNARRKKFQLLYSLKLSKKAKSSGRDIKASPGVKKKNVPEHSNLTMLQHKNPTNNPRCPVRRYHSIDNLLDSSSQANSGFTVEGLGDSCNIHTYDLPSMTRRSRLSYSDSDTDTDGYIKFRKSIDHSMPLNDTDEKVEKIRLKVNLTELGERVCVLGDCFLLIGEELNGAVAEYACALCQYSLNYQMSDESNCSLCISYNDVNIFLGFKSKEVYTKWNEDIKKNMLKVKYTSIHFAHQTSEPVYECVEHPIYERISVLIEESVDISEGEKSIEPDK